MSKASPIRAASIARDEIDRFSSQAGDWWNAEGQFGPLHRLNPVRLGYIRTQVCRHFSRDEGAVRVLEGLDALDIGCGGGLLTEPLARLGGRVTGLDASEEAITVARAHAKQSGLKIDYQAQSVEQLARGKARYDLITALEVAEHVADLDSFLAATAQLLKPGGLLIVSTLNRTAKSFLLGIVAAEYILKWVPRGTHQWKKFIRPSELVQKLEASGARPVDLTGIVFDPLSGEFGLRAGDVGMNYFLTAERG